MKDEISPCTATPADTSAASTTPRPETLWRAAPAQVMDDPHGYGRNPAFWYTLNFPYNYLYELHRFAHATADLRRYGIPDQAVNPEEHQAYEAARADLETRLFGRVCTSTADAPTTPKIDPCDPASRDSLNSRCTWVKDNPDIAAFMHALRVELLVHYVMRRIVAEDDAYPFHYWLRFEFGTSGNPHAHGLNYVAGNPTFDNVVADQETKERLQDFFDDLQTVDEAEERLANFFDPYVQEMHPAKDEGGEAPKGAAVKRYCKSGNVISGLLLKKATMPPGTSDAKPLPNR